MFTSLLENIRG